MGRCKESHFQSRLLTAMRTNTLSETDTWARVSANIKNFMEDWIHYRDSNKPLSLAQMELPQLAFILGTLAVFVVYWRSDQRQRRHLPPGPKKLPFIGNLLSMPSSAEWETFTKWGKQYSLCLIPRIIFISSLSQTPTSFTSTL
jgi:hypothetical protein